MRLDRKRKRKKCEEEEEEEEEEEKGSVLPPEILDLILLHLPLVSIVRSRSVCKSWNETIRSPDFAARKARLDRELGKLPEGWLITMIGRYKKKWVWLYDPHSGRRHKIMFPSDLTGTFYYAVAVGGLLFIEKSFSYANGICSTRLCAWNPITGFMKDLLIPHSDNYAVVATVSSHKMYPLQPREAVDRTIFSPCATSGWNRINFLACRVHSLFGTYSNGLLYRTKCFRDRNITALNMVTSENVGIDLPQELDRSCRWGVKLVECGGSLLLMAACTPSRRKSDHMQVWRLTGSPPNSGWVFVSTMPQNLFVLVFRGQVTQHNWKCTSVDDIVLISSSHRRVEEHEGVVIFDLKKVTWSKVEHVHHERQYCPWSTPHPFYPSFAGLEP